MTRYFEVIGAGNDPFVTACVSIEEGDQKQLEYIRREHSGCTSGEISENQFKEYGDNSWLIPKSRRHFHVKVTYSLE